MSRLLNLLLGTAGAFAAIIAYAQFTFDPTLPVETWYGVEVLNSPIEAGDDLLVTIRRDKVRDDCPVTSTRTAIDDDGVSHPLEPAVWRGGSSEGDALDFSYPTPTTLHSGSYTLRVFLLYTCPDFVWSTQQPDARFRVIGENDGA